MFHQKIKQCLSYSIHLVSSMISEFTYSHGALTRNRKLPPDTLISFLISQGSSSTKNKLLDFFNMDSHAPTASALNQQRAKLCPDALESVSHHFNHFSSFYNAKNSHYRFLAADGSTFTYFSKPSFSPPQYFVSEGHSAKGFFSMHLNALYDLQIYTYSDALIQPVHQKDEFRAFCDMVDHHDLLPGTKSVFIGDRGYCSYNNMAHVVKKEQYFLFRTKDIHSKGLVGNFDFPDTDSFDMQVNVTLVRSHKRTIPVKEGFYKRFVDTAASFDYVEYGSLNTYDLSFRVVRFPISDDSYECIVTNLPSDEFPPERIKLLYYARWAVEGSFRKLKYAIWLSNFHSYKPELIKQEIWAKLIAYNMTETLINHTILQKGETKHEYKVNFSRAAHICRVFLRPTTEKDSIDVMSLLQKELIPIRNDRQFPRLQTAHFRRPRYFIYRAAINIGDLLHHFKPCRDKLQALHRLFCHDFIFDIAVRTVSVRAGQLILNYFRCLKGRKIFLLFTGTFLSFIGKRMDLLHFWLRRIRICFLLCLVKKVQLRIAIRIFSLDGPNCFRYARVRRSESIAFRYSSSFVFSSRIWIFVSFF